MPEKGIVQVGRKNEEYFAEYSCDMGFSLFGGTNKLSCLPGNSQWQFGMYAKPTKSTNLDINLLLITRPECIPVKCPSTPTIKNGKVHKRVYSYGDAVDVTCDRGFVLKDDAVTCLETGSWSSGHVECEPVTCPRLREPSHGTVTYSVATPSLPWTSGATFSCNTGFKLHGAENSTCQEDGSWSAPAPQCQSMYPNHNMSILEHCLRSLVSHN